MRKFALAAAGLVILTVGAAAPAMAAPYCTGGFNGMQMRSGLGQQNILSTDEDAQLNVYKAQLRQQGVDVARLETWNGCLRAFVRQADGSQTQQFFDPGSLQRVQ
ncbi:MAG TPA: hypothetical protein VGM83_10550 [Devosiaceae bacterium]|jgi:hypothetical protein